jgi:beta-lactamase regulating signal transducer with metallopeptidase domain/5-hydroxyisourate hydrolase-like protein (transthyretin family)
MNPLAAWCPGDGVPYAGLEVLGMITLLVTAAWAAERFLARRRAALRSALWHSALVGILLTPALALTGRQLPWHVAVLAPADAATARATARPSGHADDLPTAEARAVPPAPATPGPQATVPPAGRPAPVAPRAEVRTAALPPVPQEAPAVAGEPPAPPADTAHALTTLAVLAWGLGSVYLSARLLHGAWCVRRLWRRLRPLDAEAWTEELAAVARALGGVRLPEVCLSPDVRSPLVAGLLRPRVVLPEALPEYLRPHQLREVLVHECAHAVRGDPWVRLLQRLAAVLFWVHPLVHLLNRRLDHAREEVCDNHVLAQADAPAYAETLLTVAQVCYPVPRLEGYLTMIPRHHNLERRVADLLEERRDAATRLPAVQRAAVLTALVLLLAAVSSVGLQGAAAARDEQGKAAAPAQPPAGGADKPAPPAAVGKVTGRVVQAADGRPVAGADVRLIRRGSYSGPPPTRRATTNAQGEFTFDAVAPGEYRVLSFQGNLASRTRMYRGDIVAVAADGAAKPVVLKMRPGVSVRVKVLAQADGKPLAGARVRLAWTDTDRDHFTDAQGEVELRALTAETYHVEAAANGHAAEVQILNLGNGQPAALEFKLPPGGSLEGRVRDENGRPLSGVGINPYGNERPGHPLDYVETDAEGRYRFDYLPVGQTLQLLLRKREYLDERKEFRLDADKARAARLDVVLKKRPHGGSVAGLVTDRQGKPVAGAEVVNRGGSSDEVRRAKTDAQGKFLLDNVYSDGIGHQLVVRAKGFAPQRVEFKPGPADRPAEVAVQLEPGHRIRGRVVNEAGKPISGVSVYFAQGNHFPGMEFGGSATTDAQGRFQFDSLPPRAPFAFHAEGYSAIPDTELPLDGDKEVVVTMRSQGGIQGRVVDAATGKPVPRFNVRITFSPDSQPGDPSAGLRSDRVSPGEDFVSAQGQFVLKDLMAGMPLQVSVSANGYRRQVVRRVVAQAAPEAEAVEVRLTAEDPSRLLTVRGRLVNHRGEAVRGADLRLIVATERSERREDFPFNWQMIESGQVEQVANVLQVQRRTTAADGRFEFRGIPADAEIELVYWGKGIPGGREDHLERLPEKQRTDFLVQAQAPARVTGTIDRQAFPELSSIQLSGSARFFRAVLAPDGKSFVIDDVPPGRYEVQVYGPAVRVEGQPGAFQQAVIGRKTVTLEEGQQEKVMLGEADRP